MATKTSSGATSRPGGRRRLRTLARRGAVLAVAAGTLAGVATLPAGASTASPAVAGGLATVAAAPRVPSGVTRLGSEAASTVLHLSVAFKARDAAGLQAYATEVSTPGSAVFHHFLTPAGFAQAYGPGKGAIAAVSAALRTDGLRVGQVSANGLIVHVSGPAGRVAAAFHTSIARFRLANGTSATATTSAVRLPAALASSVETVVGLDNLVRPHALDALHASASGRAVHGPADASPAPRLAGAPNACSKATADAVDSGGLTDSQIAQAYGLDGLYSQGETGTGKTVAIFELEPYNRGDIKTFDTCYFGKSAAASMLSRLSTVAVDGGQQVGYGSGESELDIENISALAPGADIDVYEAPNTEYGAADEYNAIVSADRAQVISTSWGFCELALQLTNPGVQALENTIFEEAAAQGMSTFAAAGDDGSDDCAESGASPVAPGLSVDDPGSQPFVVSVGGTTIDAIGPNGPSERVWNDGSVFGASGGGISDSWLAPSWQASDDVPGFDNSTEVTRAEHFAAANSIGGGGFCQTDAAAGTGTTPCREVPDVTAQADEFTGAITVYQSAYGGWTTFGGTSSAAPIWAALTADIASSSGCEPTNGLGFVSPLLYGVASSASSYAASFTDITAGDNDVFGSTDGLFPATKGYDMASGLGSPRVTGPHGSNGLAHYLCAEASAAADSVTVSAVTPQAVLTSGGTVTITGTGFESAGSPIVEGVQVGGVFVPASAVDVTSPTSLTVAVPTGAELSPPNGTTDGAGAYDVSVQVVGGLASPVSPASRLFVVDGDSAPDCVPTVIGVGPSGGNDAGGNTTTVYGSCLAAATGVTFGGVAASDLEPVAGFANSELTVTVPAEGVGTACAGDTDAATDICQTSVVVHNANGPSATSAILPAYAGSYALNALEIFEPPPGCGCEIAPQPTEYDYLPTPHISSLAAYPAANGNTYASKAGGTTVTLTGAGFSLLGLEWIDAGAPATAEQLFPSYVSATELQFVAPSPPGGNSVAISVQTLASPNAGQLSSPTLEASNAVELDYAGTPKITSVDTGTKPVGGPTTGGNKVTVHGTGFTPAIAVLFSDELSTSKVGFTVSTATDYDLDIVSNTELTFDAPGANPGIDDLLVCTVTACSKPSPKVDTYDYYAPGNPVVTSIAPDKGKAAGGTVVDISGSGLGCVVAVEFGSTPATVFANKAGFTDCGDTGLIVATAPPGKAGTKASVIVETVESSITGFGYSKKAAKATFTYSS